MAHPTLAGMHPMLAGKTTTIPDISVGHALLQMVLALGVIVVGIWALSKLLARLKSPRVGAKARAAGRAAGGLTVLSRQALGKDLSIATVRWNDREVLVGISGSTITFLNDARSDESSGAALDDHLENDPAPPITGRLATMLARPTEDPRPVATPGGTRASFIDSLRDATLRR